MSRIARKPKPALEYLGIIPEGLDEGRQTNPALLDKAITEFLERHNKDSSR
jgi:hypothetical protein